MKRFQQIIGSRWREWLVVLVLVLVTAAVYAPVRRFEFVNYDDPINVTQNRFVQTGLTWEGVRWAFGTCQAGQWVPLSWLSLMLDRTLYGQNPGGFHLTNLALHLAGTVLLFGAMRALTGAVWQSVAVAALFAWHPLNVETVAWVTERRMVLGGCLWMLTMLLYVRYVRCPTPGSYGVMLLAFVLALAANAMVVTLPCVLLLLDFWPLGRLGNWRRAVLEKLPLLALSAEVSVTTMLSAQNIGTLTVGASVPLSRRLMDVVLGYARYLGKAVMPANLSVYYPYPKSVEFGNVVVAGILLAVVSVVVWRASHHHRYLAVGWCWFLGVLVPVVMFMQGGKHAMNDHYAYLPLIGLYIMAVWGIGEWLGKWRRGPVTIGIGAVVVLGACVGATWKQVAVWQNSVTLFEHALAAGWESDLAHYDLGLALSSQGQTDKAITQYRKALRLNPNCPEARNNLGGALATQGRTAEAITEFRETLRLAPDYPNAHNNLGLVLAEQGQTAQAIIEFREALRIEPDQPGVLGNLAWVLATSPEATLRDGAGAVILAERACALTGHQVPVLLDTLAAAYAEAGRFPEAVAMAEIAIVLARATGQTSVADEIQSRLELYRTTRPYRQDPRHPVPPADGR